MKRKNKLIIITILSIFVLCVGAIGVFSASIQSTKIASNLSFQATDVIGRITIMATKANEPILFEDGKNSQVINFTMDSIEEYTINIPDINFSDSGVSQEIVYSFLTQNDGTAFNYNFSCNFTSTNNLHITYSHIYTPNDDRIAPILSSSDTLIIPTMNKNDTVLSIVKIYMENTGFNLNTTSTFTINLSDLTT